MKRIESVYFILKEVFGPNISLEIIDITDRANIQKIIGEEIYETTINRENLNDAEIKKILKEKTDITDIPWQLVLIKPGNILESSFSAAADVLVKFDQFPSFSKLIKFIYNHRTYVIIIVSTLLDHHSNEVLLIEFWTFIKKYLEGERINVIKEYLKSKVPTYLKSNFSIVFDILIKSSCQKIENKHLLTGLLFVNNYDDFRKNYYLDLFYDISTNLSLREIDKIKQPYLEVSDGQRNFLIVDKDLTIKGIFFPDTKPSGLEMLDTKDVKTLTPSMIAKIDGVDLIRIAVDNKLLFEIKNGFIRIRDYFAFKEIFIDKLAEIGVVQHTSDLLNNIIDISFMHKGTIIVIGDVLEKNKYCKGVDGKISICSNRHDNITYRKNILPQLSKTDGAVLIDKSLNAYCFGAILKVEDNISLHEMSGGGSRTYTSKLFSLANPAHIIVKISADGPISVYFSGNLLVEI